MHIIVRVRPGVAPALRHGARVGAAAEIARLVAAQGLTLRPLHPGATDPLLEPYWLVEGAAATAIDQLLASLTDCAGVEAAYCKPADGRPGSSSAL